MSDNNTNPTFANGIPLNQDAAKTAAMIAYGLMLLGLCTGIFWFIGGIWAMVKKDDARGTLFADHYDNAIKVFWWGIGLTILGTLLIAVLVGWIVLMGVWIWSIYRLVKGLARLSANRPYHDDNLVEG